MGPEARQEAHRARHAFRVEERLQDAGINLQATDLGVVAKVVDQRVGPAGLPLHGFHHDEAALRFGLALADGLGQPLLHVSLHDGWVRSKDLR